MASSLSITPFRLFRPQAEPQGQDPAVGEVDGRRPAEGETVLKFPLSRRDRSAGEEELAVRLHDSSPS